MEKFMAKIPYEMSALKPILSTETLTYHYGKHHCGYANNLNQQIKNTDYENQNLEQVNITARKQKDNKIFNQAAQLFNHNFYWQCLSNKSKVPQAQLLALIKEQFKSFDFFLEKYFQEANSLFGSGWSWLVYDTNNKLSFLQTSNGENPLNENLKILCVIDLWEHAYYIDYRNDRASYIKRLLEKGINWAFCEQQLLN